MDLPKIDFQRIPDTKASVGLPRLWFDEVELRRIVKTSQADAVVSLMNIGPINPGVPHIIFQRNALLFAPEHMKLFDTSRILKFRFQRSLALAAMNRAVRIITPSQSMANLVQENCPKLPSGRFSVLPHAFDPSAYSSALDPNVAQKLDRSGAKLLYPCLAGEHKGVALLLQIAKALPDKLPATTFVTGGDEGGAVVDQFKSRARELGVENRVVFLGRIPQDQMGSLYRACDLLLYVSAIESFGFALLESLAFGLPVVAVDTAVNRELCGPAAFYFSANEPNAAAAQISESLNTSTHKRLKALTVQQFNSRDRTWDSYAVTLLNIIRASAQ